MTYVGAILLNDSEGTNLEDGAMMAALKRLISSPPSHKPTNVLRGELLEMKQGNPYFNYSLSRDANICLYCSEKDIYPLTRDEFLMLEAVKIPIERLDAFSKKLTWGVQLKQDDIVYVTVAEGNSFPSERAMAIVKYKGEMEGLRGIHFGVEFLDRSPHISAIATTDGTHEGKCYFTCNEGCGLFVPLNLLSQDGAPPQACRPKENKPYLFGKPNRDRNELVSSSKYPTGSGALKIEYGGASSLKHQPDFCIKFEEDRLRQQGLTLKPPENASSVFQMDQHVVFQDKHEAKHCGVIRWTSTGFAAMAFTHPVVGIQTEDKICILDFEGLSVNGMSHQMKQVPADHALFLPETLVEKFDPFQSQGKQFAVGSDELEMRLRTLKAARTKKEEGKDAKSQGATSQSPKTEGGDTAGGDTQMHMVSQNRGPKVPIKSKTVQARGDLIRQMGKDAGRTDFNKKDELFSTSLSQRVTEEPPAMSSRPRAYGFYGKDNSTPTPLELAWKNVQVLELSSMSTPLASFTVKSNCKIELGNRKKQEVEAIGDEVEDTRTHSILEAETIAEQKGPPPASKESEALVMNSVSPFAETPIVDPPTSTSSSEEKVGWPCKVCAMSDPSHRPSCEVCLTDRTVVPRDAPLDKATQKTDFEEAVSPSQCKEDCSIPVSTEKTVNIALFPKVISPTGDSSTTYKTVGFTVLPQDPTINHEEMKTGISTGSSVAELPAMNTSHSSSIEGRKDHSISSTIKASSDILHEEPNETPPDSRISSHKKMNSVGVWPRSNTMPRSRPSPQYQSTSTAQPPVAKPRTKLPPSEKRTRSQSESGQPIPKPRKNSSETDPSRSPSVEESAQDGAGDTQEPAKDQNLSVGSKPDLQSQSQTETFYLQKLNDVEEEAEKGRVSLQRNANIIKLLEEVQRQRLVIQSKDDEIGTMRAIMKTKDEEINVKTSEISAMEQKIKTKEHVIEVQDDQIRSKDHEVQMMKETVKTVNEDMDAKERIIRTMHNQMELYRNELDATIKKMNASNDEIRTMNSKIEAKDVDIEVMGDKIKAQAVELMAKEDEIQSISRRIKAEEKKKTEQIADLHKFIVEAERRGTPTGASGHWNIPRTQIQNIEKQKIGSGAWGVVYSATFRGERVAIKQAHRAILSDKTIDMLKREVMIMSEIHYPNLMKFIGAVIDDAVERGTDMPIIVFELMDMDLREAYAKINLSNSLISIFCDVAYALHYLHQRRQPIIHRDLSAPNVLIKILRSGAYQAKVSDFGSANHLQQALTAAPGAIAYTAPEMFPTQGIMDAQRTQPQTVKVDVYSYGILILEVLAKEIPTTETCYIMLQRLRVSHEWSELIVHCTKHLPSDRPTMAGILNKLYQLPHPH